MLLGGRDLTAIADLDIDVAQGRPAGDAFHRAGVRHDYDVVLIDTLRAQTFRRQNSSDRERDIFDSDNLANRIVVAVNL